MTLRAEEDGKRHINIYSRGATAMGRELSNFSAFEFDAPDGAGEIKRYASVEAYWYDLGLELDERESAELRKLTGHSAKKKGQQLKEIRRSRRVEGFQELILSAIRAKITSQPWLEEAVRSNDLPYVHYYVFGNKVHDAGHRWIAEGIQAIANELKSTRKKRLPRKAAEQSKKPDGAGEALKRVQHLRPEVVNVKGLQGQARLGIDYVGRDFAGWAGSPLGNPFPVIGKGWNARSREAADFVIAHGDREQREAAEAAIAQRGCPQGEAVALYRHWLKLKLKVEPAGTIAAELMRLAELNKRSIEAARGVLKLGCWCHPNACHADVIADAVALLTARLIG